jgi:hypothetical protein
MSNLIAFLAVAVVAGFGATYRSGLTVGICIGLAYMLGVSHG